jgi:hypothetical protein
LKRADISRASSPRTHLEVKARAATQARATPRDLSKSQTLASETAMNHQRPATHALRTILLRTIFFCTTLLLLFAHATRAQTPTPEDKSAGDAAREAQARLEGRALKLLEEIGDEAQGLRLAQNRVRTQVAVADLLWPHDEKRAREIFNEAMTSLASVTSSISADDPRRDQLIQEMLNLRNELMQSIAAHDPQLALDFLHATRPPSVPMPGRNYYQVDQETQLEAGLAEQVAARDPHQALKIADDILSRGLSGQLSNLLERMRGSDPSDAAKLAAEIAQKLHATNLNTNYEVANLAVYLLNATRQADAGAPNNVGNFQRGGRAPGAGGSTPIALDDQTRRDLLSQLVNAALAPTDARNGNGAQYLLNSLQQFMPDVERYVPAQAQALRSRSAQLTRANASMNPGQQEYQNAMQATSLDAMLDLAAKASPEMRGQIYSAAAWRAMNEGATERARQIIGEHIENPQQRAQMLDQLVQQAFFRAANAGDIEQARALLLRFKEPEQQAQMLLQLANMVAARGNGEAARRLLDEVWNQIGGRAKNQSQFNLQLEAARAYTRFAPDRAFEIVDAATDRINELITAAAVLDGFGQESFEQDELKTQNSNWISLVNQCGATLTALARTDFDRALSSADRLQRPETRVAARLAVARGALNQNALPNNGRVVVRSSFSNLTIIN